MSDERYWTYKAGSPTPGHAEAVATGAFEGTEQQWHALTPGMRREIVRTHEKRLTYVYGGLCFGHRTTHTAGERNMTHPLIAAALAAPKTHKVVTTYDNGTVKTHWTAGLAQADNWATGERRKIGRSLVDRITMDAVRVVSVEIEAI